MVWLRQSCSVGKTCPQVGRRRDAPTLLIQGWIADGGGGQDAESPLRTVELPEWLLPGLARSGRPGYRSSVRAGEPTVLVTAPPLRDSAVLLEAAPPRGEVVVEVPLDRGAALAPAEDFPELALDTEVN